MAREDEHLEELGDLDRDFRVALVPRLDALDRVSIPLQPGPKAHERPLLEDVLRLDRSAERGVPMARDGDE
ncbi:hypothetical protein D3C83_70410 [compost metagenome]